jgi:hypothetical protein
MNGRLEDDKSKPEKMVKKKTKITFPEIKSAESVWIYDSYGSSWTTTPSTGSWQEIRWQ